MTVEIGSAQLLLLSVVSVVDGVLTKVRPQLSRGDAAINKFAVEIL